jgi:hypothetical protein
MFYRLFKFTGFAWTWRFEKVVRFETIASSLNHHSAKNITGQSTEK